MRAAAENLVPVTLELGGKSPVIISRTADVRTAAARIMAGKTLNAGQICLAPDYVLAPEDKLGAFVDESRKAVERMYPTIKDNPDYTSIVAQRHFERINDYLDDARAKGAEVVDAGPGERELHPAGVPQDPADAGAEPYRRHEGDAGGDLRPRHAGEGLRPGRGGGRLRQRARAAAGALLVRPGRSGSGSACWSGPPAAGVTVNDVIFHVAQEDLPFGGVGPAGMGSYHGYDGFREFSHRKAVYHQVKKDLGPLAAMRPPYGEAMRKYLDGAIKR
jgi:coniferyl-aldehyde dehydrogenase